MSSTMVNCSRLPTMTDPRFATNPLVTEATGIRSMPKPVHAEGRFNAWAPCASSIVNRAHWTTIAAAARESSRKVRLTDSSNVRSARLQECRSIANSRVQLRVEVHARLANILEATDRALGSGMHAPARHVSMRDGPKLSAGPFRTWRRFRSKRSKTTRTRRTGREYAP